jgi:hypothetical protein
VGVEGEQGRKYPECTDAELPHLVEGGKQGATVLQAELVKPRQLLMTFESHQAFCRGAAEFDWRLSEQAAEAEA